MMNNRAKKYMVITALGIMMSAMIGFGKADAAGNNVKIDENNRSASLSCDMDGDGKSDTISVTSRYNSDYMSFDSVSISINGKKVFTKKKAGYTFAVEYVKLDNKNEFLHLQNETDNLDPTIDGLFRYNKFSGKLEKMITFDSVYSKWPKGVCHIYASIAKVKKNSILVSYNGQMMATGYITFVYEYRCKNGKVELIKDTANVNKGGKYTAKKTITFYKSAGSNSEAFTISAGKSATLKKVRKYKGAYYLMFKYGSKTGWISADNSEIFSGVQLAG